MMLSRCRPWLVASLVTLTVPTLIHTSPAQAQQLTKEEARALFQEALALVAAGDYSSAHEKLQKVAQFRRTPQVAFYIGVCLEKTGKLVMALGEYRISLADARAAGANDVVVEATEAIAKLEPRIPMLTITKGQGAQAATIAVDGKTIGDPAIGKPMPFDPGTRTIVAQAPSYRPYRQEVQLGEGEKASLEITMERRSGDAAAPAPTPRGTSDRDGAQPEESDASSTSMTVDSGSGTRTFAWIASGVGVAGLGASGYFFYQRSRAVSKLDKACGDDRQSCPLAAKKKRDEGKRDTLLGNVALGVGAAGVVTGVILFLASSGSSEGDKPTQPDQPGLSLRFQPPGDSWAGLTLDGRF